MDAEDERDLEELLSRGRAARFGRRGRKSLYDSPEFTKRLSAFTEATAGSDVTFECQWHGFPRPTLRWYRDDEMVVNDDHSRMVEDDGGAAILSISKVMKKDEGAYKCKAENSEGVTSSTGYLSVTGDYTDRPLSSQGRQSEHAVSNPPPLRTIIEQKSMEEREENAYPHPSTSPVDEILEEAAMQGQGWPAMLGLARKRKDKRKRPGEEDYDSGSDTSVESQDGDLAERELTPDADLIIDEGDVIPHDDDVTIDRSPLTETVHDNRTNEAQVTTANVINDSVPVEYTNKETEVIPNNVHVAVNDHDMIPTNTQMPTNGPEMIPINTQMTPTNGPEMIPINTQMTPTNGPEMIPTNTQMPTNGPEMIPAKIQMTANDHEMIPLNMQMPANDTHMIPIDTQVPMSNKEMIPSDTQMPSNDTQMIFTNTQVPINNNDISPANVQLDTNEETNPIDTCIQTTGTPASSEYITQLTDQIQAIGPYDGLQYAANSDNLMNSYGAQLVDTQQIELPNMAASIDGHLEQEVTSQDHTQMGLAPDVAPTVVPPDGIGIDIRNESPMSSDHNETEKQKSIESGYATEDLDAGMTPQETPLVITESSLVACPEDVDAAMTQQEPPLVITESSTAAPEVFEPPVTFASVERSELRHSPEHVIMTSQLPDDNSRESAQFSSATNPFRSTSQDADNDNLVAYTRTFSSTIEEDDEQTPHVTSGTSVRHADEIVTMATVTTTSRPPVLPTEDILPFPWLEASLIIAIATFIASALEPNPSAFVLIMFLISIISFRIILSGQKSNKE